MPHVTSPAWLEAARKVAALPRDEFVRRWQAIEDPEVADDVLRMRFRFDRGAFLKYILPEVFELPWNEFHVTELTRTTPPWAERKAAKKTIRRAIAAPRGIAKTTLLKGELVHDVVYGLEKFVVVLSAEERLALSINRDVRAFFQDGQSRLARLYGPFDVVGQTEEFAITCPGAPWPVAFLARSFGTQVRGANYRTQRPTKIVVDDGERPDRVRNPDQRKIGWSFLHDDVLKAGPAAGGCLVEWRGTVLHPDSILSRILVSPGWYSKKWQAMKKWPVNRHVWDECHAIWANLANERRLEDARAFYEAHRVEMDEGAEVLDENTRDLYSCFELIWSEGLASFLRECQNEPVDPSARLFDTSRMARCKVERDHIVAKDGRRIPFSELVFWARLDPALGKDAGMPGDTGAGAGDFASIAVIAMDRFGYGYVVDVWLKRARPDEQLQQLWTMRERWPFQRLSIESNGFQSLLGRDFKRLQLERRNEGKVWQIQVDEDVSSVPKDERIASLDPAVSNDWLQFATTLSGDVLTQFEEFPTGAHDDAPDAVEGAWRLARAPRQGGGRIT
jgi:predicted phage terminase large subunit-like protein